MGNPITFDIDELDKKLRDKHQIPTFDIDKLSKDMRAQSQFSTGIEPTKVENPYPSFSEKLSGSMLDVSPKAIADRLPQRKAMQDVEEGQKRAFENKFTTDPEYRANWFRTNMGMTEDEFKSASEKSFKERLQGLASRYENIAQDAIDEVAQKNAIAPQMAEFPRLTQKVGSTKRQLRGVKDILRSFENNSFWSGLREGFALDNTLSFGLNELVDAVTLKRALEKQSAGEELNEKEQFAIEASQLYDDINETYDLLGGRSGWNAVGQGAGESAGFVAQMALTGGMGFSGSLLKSLGVKAGVQAVKNAARNGIRSAVGEALKQSGKVVGRGLYNTGLTYVESIPRAALTPGTYSRYVELRNERLKNGESLEGNWLEDAGRAGIEMTHEIASEIWGSHFIYDSFSAIGKAIGLNKAMDAIGFGRRSRTMLGWTPNAGTREVMRNLGYSGDLLSELASEAAGDVATNLAMGVFFDDAQWEQMATKQYWTTLLGVTALQGSAFRAVNMALNIPEYRRLNEMQQRRDTALSNIKSEKLRKDLEVAFSYDTAEEMGDNLSQIDWNSYDRIDAANAMDAVRLEVPLRIATGEREESERIARFAPYLENVMAQAYQGVDAENPSPQPISVIAQTEDGKVIRVESGDYNNPDAMLNVVDEETGERFPIIASRVSNISEVSIQQQVNEAYKMMFSMEENVQRLSKVMESLGRLAYYGEASSEDARGIITRAGFKVFEEGEVVVLVNGQEVEIASPIMSDGHYIVRDANGNTSIVSLLDVVQPAIEIAEAQIKVAQQQEQGETESVAQGVEQSVNESLQGSPMPEGVAAGEIWVTPQGIGRVLEYNPKTGKAYVDINLSSDTMNKEEDEELVEVDATDLKRKPTEQEMAEARARSVRRNALRIVDETSDAVGAIQDVEEVAQPVEPTAEAIEQAPQEVPSMENVPMTADGIVDYDAITDADMYARLLIQDLGSKEEALEAVNTSIEGYAAEVSALQEKAKKEKNMTQRVALTKQAAAVQQQLDVLNQVRDIITPQEVQETPMTGAEQIAETPQVEETQQEPIGLVQDDFTATLPEAKLIDSLARSLGLSVEFVDQVNEGNSNAQILGNKVLIAKDEKSRDRAIKFLVGHEFTHRMQDLSPESYAQFKQAVKDYLGTEAFEALLQKEIAKYRKHNIYRTQEQLEDEVIADFAGSLALNTEVFDTFAAAHADKKSMWQAILDVLRAIREWMLKDTAYDTAEARALQNAIGKLENLLQTASEEVAEGATAQSTEARRSLKEQVAEILDEYNTEGVQYSTPRDVADALEGVIAEASEDTTMLENIIADFRNAQDDSRSWGERWDSGGEEAFIEALQMWSSPNTQYSDALYSLKETDPATLEALNNGEKIKVYRGMQVIDGKLYPPMSAKVDGKMREPIELGVWERAEERPDLADAKGYFKLDKGNKTSLKARYNPYIHTSLTPLNDQFSSAQDRPNLVTVEVEIPASELTSGYKADKAKDAVGKVEWKAGVVQSQLSGTRTVILSRWDRPLRIVPDSEVAQRIVEMFGDKKGVMPSNVVTPSLRAELEKLGVPFKETDNQGKERYSIRLPKEEYTTLSSIIMTRQHTYKRPSFDYAFTGRGFYVYDYLGDGDSIVNFAMPIVGNEEIIDIIYKAIDNGTINSPRSLDTFVEEIQSGKRGDIDYNANALKKYKRYRGVHIHIPSSTDNYSGGVSEVGGIDSRRSATRGEGGNSNGLGDEVVKNSPKDLDNLYLDAVARGDMAMARRMVQEAAEHAGYLPDTSYQGSLAFNGAAPTSNVYFETKEERKQAWNNEEFDDTMSLGDYADNGIDTNDLEWRLTNAGNYRRATKYEKESIDNINKALKNPERKITIYRAVPNSVVEGSVRNGDWVTPSRSYAEYHIGLQDWEGGRVIEQEVSIDDIWWGGDDINEWGYDDGSNYGYRNTENNRKLLDTVTYDDAGNIIPLSERFNPEKADVRYSAKDIPSLVGVHNISLEKLRKVIKLGGSLANPSVAVLDIDKSDHTDYGEYSLILPKNMVDARLGRNAGTWAGDAWTPTYPPIIKRIKNSKDVSRFYKDINKLPEEIRNRVSLQFDSYLEGRDANSFYYWFLFENGMAPDLQIIPSRYSDEIVSALQDATDGRMQLYGLSPEQRMKVLDVFIQQYYQGDKAEFEATLQNSIDRLQGLTNHQREAVRKRAQQDLADIQEYGFDYDEVAEFVRDVERDISNRGRVDVEATIRSAKESVEQNNLSDNFDKWRDAIEERYGIEEFVFNGYTPSGTRKYLPHTTENVSKYMKKQGRTGAASSFPSFGLFIATIIPRMTTLNSIRKRKGQLGNSEQAYNDFKEKWEDVYYSLGLKLQPDAERFEDYGFWRLIEAASKPNPQKYIKDQYNIDFSNEDMATLNEMLEAIKKSYPARYFETKFERPVELTEFVAAVVPDNIPSDVEDYLRKSYLNIYKYDKESESSRREATLKAVNSPSIRFSLKDTFYSNAENAVRLIKQEKATPEQWLKMIEKNGGLKAGEDKWLGLSDWLKSSDKKTLTKDEVLDYIHQNQIQIEEVNYAEVGSPFIDRATRKLEAEMKEIGIEAMREKYPDFDDFFEVFQGELVWSEQKASEGEYEDYIIENNILDVDTEAEAINETRLRYTTNGLDNNREIALTVPTIEPWNASDAVHFGDAGGGRAVAWIRFGETADAEGKRVLVIDEIQSKRHQEGREKGYRSDEEVKNAKERLDALQLEQNALVEEIRQGLDESSLDYARAPLGIIGTDEQKAKMKEYDKALNEASREYRKLVYDTIPNAPFEKNWAELAMKRMLRYAAENGYDKVAWTTGEQQADRYNMSTSVSKISRRDNNLVEGKRFMFGGNTVLPHKITINNEGIVISSTLEGLEGKPLADVVGKEMAVKMMQMENNTSLEDADLKIGGSGMKAFYDQMLPSFVRKYAKKWGATVGEVTMPNLEENNTMHSVDVTPAMRESVMQGQPLFSLKDEVAFNNKVEDARRIAREYNIPQTIFVTDTTDEYIALMRDLGDNNFDKRNHRGRYISKDDAICLNGGNLTKHGQLFSTLIHEYTHSVTRLLWEELKAIKDTLNEADILAFRDNELSQYGNISALTTLNEIISKFVGGIPLNIYKRCMSGDIAISDIVAIISEESNEYGIVIEALKPLIIKNLEYQKQKYNEQREKSPIIIPRRSRGIESSNAQELERRGNLGSLRNGAGFRGRGVGFEGETPTTTEGRVGQNPQGDSEADGGEVSVRHHLKDNVSDEVAERLEKIHQSNISRINDRFDNEIAAIERRTREMSNNGVYRRTWTNTQKVDFLLSDGVTAAPIADQVLADIARGQKLRWNDSPDGRKRGLSTKLGLDSARNEGMGAVMEELERTYLNAAENASAEEAVRRLDVERENALREENRRYAEDLARYAADPQAIRDEFYASDMQGEFIKEEANAIYDIERKVRTLQKKLDNLRKKQRTSRAEQRQIIDEIKQEIRKAINPRNARYFNSVKLRSLINTINATYTIKGMERAKDRVLKTFFDENYRMEKERRDALTKSKINFNTDSKSVESYLEGEVAAGHISKGTMERILADRWRGVNSRGVSVARFVDGDTAIVMDVIAQNLKRDSSMEPSAQRQQVESAIYEMAEKQKFSQELVDQLIDATYVLEDYWLADQMKEVSDSYAAELEKVNEEITEIEIELLASTSLDAEQRELYMPQIQAALDAALRRKQALHDQHYADMPNIINAMNRANNAVAGILATGKVALSQERYAKKKRDAQIVRDAVDDLTNYGDARETALLDSKVGISGVDKRESWIEKAKQRVWDDYIWSLDYMLRSFGRFAPDGSGRVYMRFMPQINEAWSKYRKQLAEVQQAIDDKINRLWGKKKSLRKDVKAINILMEEAENIQVATISYAVTSSSWKDITNEGGSIEPTKEEKTFTETQDLSMAQALYLLASWGQSDGRMKLEANGITEADINNVRQAIQRIDARYLDFMDWVIDELLPSCRERYNEVHRNLFGTYMTSVDNYFPLKVTSKYRHIGVDVSEENVERTPLSINPGAIINRTHNTNMIDLTQSFFKVLAENVSEMERWAAMMPVATDINTMLSNSVVRNYTEAAFGPSFHSQLRDRFAVATGQGIRAPKVGMESSINTLLRFWASTKIGFRFFTAFKQLSSLPAIFTYSMSPTFLKEVGIASSKAFSTLGWGSIKFCLEKFPQFRERLSSLRSGDVTLMKAIEQGSTQVEKQYKGAFKTMKILGKMHDALTETLSTLGFAPNAYVDAISSSIIAMSVYNYEYNRLQKLGHTPEEADRLAVFFAENAFNQTQQSAEYAYLAPGQLSPSMVDKAITVFQNSTFLYTRQGVQGLREMTKAYKRSEQMKQNIQRREARRLHDLYVSQGMSENDAQALAQREAAKIATKEWRKTFVHGAGNFAWGLFLGNFTFALIGNIFAYFNSWDDDDERKKLLWDDVKWNLMASPARGVPGGSALVSSLQYGRFEPFGAMSEFSEDIAEMYRLMGKMGDEGFDTQVAWLALEYASRWGIGVDLNTFNNVFVKGLYTMIDEGASQEAIMHFLNVPQSQIRLLAGKRREDETFQEYLNRVRRIQTKYEVDMNKVQYYTDSGAFIGNDESQRMTKKQEQALRTAYKQYEEAYMNDILKKYNSAISEDWDNTEERYLEITKEMGWTPNRNPNHDKVTNDAGEYIGRLPREIYMQMTQKQSSVAHFSKEKSRFVGDDKVYAQMLDSIYQDRKQLIQLYDDNVK